VGIFILRLFVLKFIDMIDIVKFHNSFFRAIIQVMDSWHSSHFIPIYLTICVAHCFINKHLLNVATLTVTTFIKINLTNGTDSK
jgi:hypothetical protein